MQKQATMAIETLNEIDMGKIRQSVDSFNYIIGQEIPQMINVETDSCNNNPIFKTDSMPLQSGTIVTTIMFENNTKNKKILGSFGTKGRQFSVQITRGTALQISNRTKRLVVKESGFYVKIANFTCAGDSRSYAGVCKGRKHKIGHLKDLRHLGNSLRREMNKAPFTKGMLSGCSKVNLRSRFGLSVKSRCLAELKSANKKPNGNITALKKIMPKVTETIVLCFKGYCGKQCRQFNYVCNGNFKQVKNCMPENVKVKMTQTDEQ
ncbi:LOW QUALITY PROTEIN: hypothetical protein MAR_032087, partial [Mya arenaria]